MKLFQISLLNHLLLILVIIHYLMQTKSALKFAIVLIITLAFAKQVQTSNQSMIVSSFLSEQDGIEIMTNKTLQLENEVQQKYQPQLIALLYTQVLNIDLFNQESMPREIGFNQILCQGITGVLIVAILFATMKKEPEQMYQTDMKEENLTINKENLQNKLSYNNLQKSIEQNHLDSPQAEQLCENRKMQLSIISIELQMQKKLLKTVQLQQEIVKLKKQIQSCKKQMKVIKKCILMKNQNDGMAQQKKQLNIQKSKQQDYSSVLRNILEQKIAIKYLR